MGPKLLYTFPAIWLCIGRAMVEAQSPTVPRWGQAVSLVQDTLYVHGGRTDQFNSYSYSAAPVTNDLFSLSLASSFDASSPPWKTISGCSNCSSEQGPAVAWHTLSTFNTTSLLLFGGDPGPNSPISLPVQSDSAVMLNVVNQEPSWNFENSSWANEPLRRIYHSSSSSKGKIWIVGGSKADGSDTAFSEHYVFDPDTTSFTQLSSNNAPPDIYGHQSVVLPNGWLLILGGYSPSQKTLVPFTEIWAIDTANPNNGWTTLDVSDKTLPTSRRGFAAVTLDAGRILIHGGADAELQQTFNDGWILDLTQKPVVWSSVNTLSQLGNRKDHFAVALGQVVFFGFGYGSNGPASASLSIFNFTSSNFLSSFTPSIDPSPPLTTLPGTYPTGITSSASGSQPSGTATSPPGSAEFPYPTSTSTTPPGNNNGNGNGNSPSNPNPSGGNGDGKSNTTAIALGTVFGIIALMVGAAATAWYMRNRRSQDSFHLLSGPGDDEDSPHMAHAIPIAGAATIREKGLPMPPLVRNVKDRLSTFVPGQHAQTYQGRRDMLADEDTRVFENERAAWWGTGLRRDTSSGRSSFQRPSISDRVYGSWVSLRNVGGAVLDYASGTVKREGSTGSKSTAWRREKEATDPFSDDWGLVKPVQSRRGRQGSSYSYTDPYDPFEDYDVESLNINDDVEYRDYPPTGTEYHPPPLNDAPPRPYLHVPAQLDLTRLTPLSERPSLSTVTEQSAPTPTDSSQSMPLSPFATIGPGSSSSSHEPQSPRRLTSLIDANPPPAEIHRSNSWWSRFYKTPLLDRRASETRLQNVPTDFRDPNPPPSRLNPIEEAHSPEIPSNHGSRDNSNGTPGHIKVFSTHQHGRSASSLQTSKTANSETIEKMGRSYDIVMRGTMSSHESGASASSSVDEIGTDLGHITKPLSIVTSRSSDGNDELHFVQSPEQFPSGGAMWGSPTVRNRHSRDYSSDIERTPSPPRRSSPPYRSPPSASGGKVAQRIQAYERRMSQQELLKSPPAVKSTKRIQYGLAPRPSLFVANPDRSRSSSADS